MGGRAGKLGVVDLTLPLEGRGREAGKVAVRMDGWRGLGSCEIGGAWRLEMWPEFLLEILPGMVYRCSPTAQLLFASLRSSAGPERADVDGRNTRLCAGVA